MGGIRLEREGPVAVLTLDRPSRGNAIDMAALLHDLPAAWCEVRDDDAVRAVVLTGAGERHFTTGIDLGDPALASYSSDADHDTARFTARLNDVWKPVVAAVNGSCLGGGLALVADSDVVMASTNAWFQNPGVTHDMVVAQGSVVLARRCGLGPVLLMGLLGAHGRLDAETALRVGLVTSLHPPGELMDAAMGTATAIAGNPPAAVSALLRALWAASTLPLPEALAAASEHQTAWIRARRGRA